MVDSSTTTTLLERLDERASQMGVQLSNDPKPSEHQNPGDDRESKTGLEIEQPPRLTEVGPFSHPDDFSHAIQDVAEFAWSLSGINESLAQQSEGNSRSKLQPPKDRPVSKPRRPKRQRQAPANSPFHLFDMAAALLNSVEENQDKSSLQNN